MRDPTGIALNGRKTLLAALIVVGFFAALLAPNLLWLSRSTLKISNGSAWPLEQIEVEVIGGRETIEILPPGAKAMILLPVTGESDLKLRYHFRISDSGAVEQRSCNAGYIESGLYHVLIEVDAQGTPDCWVELASFKRLLIFELF
ncbi:hypothetical protein [Pelagibius sp. Alg239-R121]|uniref:hypothetical protein n=1 Tax=Pelagibius sp. Alg239-R121 TaxID=2993448 RepID=UPI0024A68FE3|nr:hypothetical protein [Pelagibius sp. Alg239-R121]